MNKNIKFALVFTFLFAIFGININAQVKKGDLIDGIAVVVGDEHVEVQQLVPSLRLGEHQL